MGSILVGRILMALLERPVGRPTDVELPPLCPEAWAAWAQSYAAEQAALRSAEQAQPATRGGLAAWRRPARVARSR